MEIFMIENLKTKRYYIYFVVWTLSIIAISKYIIPEEPYILPNKDWIFNALDFVFKFIIPVAVPVYLVFWKEQKRFEKEGTDIVTNELSGWILLIFAWVLIGFTMFASRDLELNLFRSSIDNITYSECIEEALSDGYSREVAKLGCRQKDGHYPNYDAEEWGRWQNAIKALSSPSSI